MKTPPRFDRAKKCRHFTGITAKVCEAGINYQAFRDLPESQKGMGICLPCIGELGCTVTCDKFEPYTKEELDAQDKAIQDSIKGFTVARPAIIEECDRLGFKKGVKGISGKIPCPVCEKGDLHFSRSSYNGHVHAKCTTANCMAWME